MLTRGRVYLVTAVVLGLACGLLVVVWGSISPDPEPGDLEPMDGPSVPSATPPAPKVPAPAVPTAAAPATDPSGRGLSPVGPGAPIAAAPKAVPAPVNGASESAAGPEDVLARLVDRAGAVLPHVPVTVRTVNPPREVLTGRGVRTDPAGQFRFRAPGRSGVLHLSCPRFAISARRAWRPEEGAGMVDFRLDRAAVVGRLVGTDGQTPRWPGFHLRLSLVPSAGAGGASAPVAFVPRTGAFTALTDGTRDVDLEVVAVGDTGRRQLARVPRVNETPMPLTVTITSPVAHFGMITLALTSVPSVTGKPSLEAVAGGDRFLLPLALIAGNRHRIGPLAPRVYQVRVVDGADVSAWRTAAVKAGRTLDLGALALRPAGRLHVRPLGGDGATLRGVRISLEDLSAGAVPVRFQEDGPGLLATHVSPGRYRVRAHPPRNGFNGSSGPDVAEMVQVQPGGVHEVIIRLP